LTNFVDKTINDMTYGVTLTAVTQDIFFTDTIANGHGLPSYCGLRNYLLSPVKAFMSISADLLTIQTTDESFVGSYDITLTATLPDYPSRPAIVKNFKVHITCTAQTVTFVAPLIPAFTTLQVGIDT
jgi:hypothetical protein